jgi:hypothetical protein
MLSRSSVGNGLFETFLKSCSAVVSGLERWDMLAVLIVDLGEVRLGIYYEMMPRARGCNCNEATRPKLKHPRFPADQ